jgi:hypothetical protein
MMIALFALSVTSALFTESWNSLFFKKIQKIIIVSSSAHYYFT